MNSSNSFNICPRCGNSNSLNAKYCARCGSQLKVPTEAVVCHKCHTRNSSIANFCRNCGATLKVGAQTKICPRCGREIGAEENMCACGYSFVTMQQTEPRRADVSSTNRDKKKDKKRDKDRSQQPAYNDSYNDSSAAKEKKPKTKKGGRGFALFALILIAIFAYAIISQVTLRGPVGQIDKGYFYTEVMPYVDGMELTDKDMLVITKTEEVDGANVESQVIIQSMSGYSLLKDTFDLLFNVETNLDNEQSAENLEDVDMTMYDVYKMQNELAPISKLDFFKQMYGTGGMIILAMIALFIVTSLLHVLSCIIRLISPRRSKRGNLLYLILAILTTLIAALIICAHFFAESEGFLQDVYKFLIPAISVETESASVFVPYTVGYAAAYIPVAYWILWLYSCIAKKKSPKKSKKAE